MHKIEVHPTQVICSCGFNHFTVTGSEALRLGYNHGQISRPSAVVDRRLCSDVCKASQENATFFGLHHKDCFHTNKNLLADTPYSKKEFL